jgi:hypothetical protein
LLAREREVGDGGGFDKKDANSIFVFHVYHPVPMLYESKR